MSFSLSIMSSEFIHVVACIRISYFLRLDNVPLYVHNAFCLYIYLFDGHLGCFHILANVNHAAMNTEIQILVQVSAFQFLGCITRSGIARSYSNSIFSFLRNCHIVFCSGCTIFHSYQQCTGFQPPHILVNMCSF